MGPFDDVLGSLQQFSQGGSAASNMVGFGLSLAGQNPGYQGDKMQAQAMTQLSDLYKKNNYDPAKAMVDYVQTPEAHQLMAVPGAFKSLIKTFQDSVKNVNPLEAAGIPNTSSGVITRGGGAQPMMTQQANPTGINTPPSTTTSFFQGGQPKGTVQGMPEPFQNFKAFADNFGKGMPQSLIDNMAMLGASPNELAQRQVMAEIAKKQGMNPQAADAWAQGRFNLLQIKDFPGLYFLQDAFNPQSLVKVPVLGGAPLDSNSAGSSATGGTGAGNIPSGSPPVNPANTPTRQSANPADPRTQGIAQKYGIRPDAVNQDGTVDPVTAYGPGSLLALTSGLPAIIHQDAATIGQWFNLADKSAANELSQKGVAMQDGLQYLAMADLGNQRLKAYSQSILDMLTGHEKESSPLHAIQQLENLRNVYTIQYNANKEQLTRMGPDSVGQPNQLPYDKDTYLKLNEAQKHLENVLGFVPSNEALESMKRGIQDGVINAPTFATAAKSVKDVAGAAIGAGLHQLFGGKSIQDLNENPTDTIGKIKTANAKQLMELIKAGADPSNQLSDPIRKALSDRFEELRTQARAGKKTQGGQALPYAPGGNKALRQTPSVKEFTENPARTAANPYERNKQLQRSGVKETPFSQRFPDGGGWVQGPGPNIDNAFSNVNDEFPLANGLRARAKQMQAQ